MLTDETDPQVNRLRTEEHKPLKEELERLLEHAVAEGNRVNLAALIKQGASVNVEHIDTSLLATAVMNKKAEMVSCLLNFHYLITEVDIEEIRTLIQELKAIKTSDALDEKNKTDLNEGLAVLRALMQDHPHKIVNDKILGLKAEINAAIVEFSQPSATVSTTNNTVSAATTLAVASVPPPPLLHAFQDVNASVIGIDMLFSFIANQAFDNFSGLLKWLISQNAMFNINAKDTAEKTLLHHASINLDDRFLKILLANKANPNIGDKYGWTPVHWAAFTGKNFGVFMENTTFAAIDWMAKTKRHETILQLAEKGKKNSKENLDFIDSKVSKSTELKNALAH